MSVISTSLRNLSAFLQDHQVSFSSGLLILFTIGGEQIFRFNAFQCPCTQPDAYYYAVIFMIVPAFILGVTGVVVSNLTWRIFHGCQYRSKTSKNGFRKSSGYFFIVIARAAVVPVAWLFITLLDGNYYACMQAKNPCERKSEEYIHLLAESQNISWISLGSLVLISLIVICVVRCCDSVTYIQYKYLHCYREAEQAQWDNLIQENTGKLAETNVKAFMQQPYLNKEDWDDISKAPDQTVVMKDKADEGDHSQNLPLTPPHSEKKSSTGTSKVFLTPLHEWATLHKTQQDQGEMSQV